jgi:hypothetical protein
MHSTAGALLEAVQHHRAGRREQAAAICRAVLAGDPVQPRALFLSGLLLLDENRAEEAARMFARAVAGDPTHRGTRRPGSTLATPRPTSSGWTRRSATSAPRFASPPAWSRRRRAWVSC